MHERQDDSDTHPVLRVCRTVAAQLVGGLWPGRQPDWVEARIATLPPLRQVGLIGAVLALLFGSSLFAAQFGLLGMAAFFLLVILVIA